ncbi:MAG: DNA polymerase III subunit gamma/tau [Pseudomonadota bacterium]
MSYQVLARKYRPRRFEELVGQDVVARALSHALEQNRLHHAYLLTGTRGVGKTTIARILARCLNCETGITATPCGVCSSCREIEDGRFADLLEIDAASNTGVDNVRELIDNAQYLPTRGRYKVYLIDEVHMLSKAAFNALLKTLEEPPPHVKFLLATTDPQKLPITILSRCLQFALKPMTPERVVGHLQHVLQAEAITSDDGSLWLLARAAQGSMRDALSLTDQAIAFGQGELREAEVRSLLGSIDRDLVFRVLDAIHAGDAAALLQVVAGMAEQSIDFAGALGEIITVLHRLAVAQAVPDAIDNAEGDRDRLLTLAAALTAEDLQLYYQMAIQGRRDLPLAVDPRAGFEMTVLRMLAFRPLNPAVAGGGGVAVSAPVKRSEAGAAGSGLVSATPSEPAVPAVLARSAAAAPASVQPAVSVPSFMSQPVVTTAPASAATPVAAISVEPPVVAATSSSWTAERWADWVEHSGLTGAAINLARNALLVERTPTRWELQLSPRHQMLAGGQALPQLQQKLTQHFPDRNIPLEFVEPGDETPAQRRQRLQSERLHNAEAALRQDPVVKALISTFDATLVADSITLPH